MRIAITTPTGKIGSALVDILQTQGKNDLILLARHPEKLIEAQQRGARVVQGDLYDEDYVARATRGADALFWVGPPNMHTDDMCADFKHLAENAATAIDDNGISHVVHISSIGAQSSARLGPVLALRDAEILMDQTNASITHLRTGYFMDNYLWSADTIDSHGTIFLPVAGSVRVPMIYTGDIAREAARVLTDPSWYGRRMIEVVGPSDVSFDEAAIDIGAALHRDIRHVMVTLPQAREMMTAMGFSRHCTAMMLDLYAGINNGLYCMEHPRSEAIVTPTTFIEFARSTLIAAVHATGAAMAT